MDRGRVIDVRRRCHMSRSLVAVVGLLCSVMLVGCGGGAVSAWTFAPRVAKAEVAASAPASQGTAASTTAEAAQAACAGADPSAAPAGANDPIEIHTFDLGFQPAAL